jgi:predicted permease
MRCYPKAFRDAFGADLARQYCETGARSPVRAVVVALDLAAGGLGARWDDARRAGAAPSSGAIGGLWRDAAFGVRMLRRRPAASAAMVATLGLAAGLAAAVFGIYDATLVRPLPYPDAGRIVSVGSMWNGFDHSSVSAPEYFDYRDRARALEHIALIRTLSVNLTDGPDGPERVDAAQVTSSFFDVLGVPAAHGRVFLDDEAAPDGPAVAVVSHAFWTRRFGRSPGAVGVVVRMNDQPVTIVGVMPASFRLPERATDVWLPLRVDPGSAGGRGAHTRQVLARVRDGVGVDAAAGELARIGAQLQVEYPENYPDGSGWGVSVKSLRDLLVGDLREPLALLLAAVLFVLLIAAANVSGLLLARTTERRTELATRAALGASRVRIIRQIVAEGVVAGLAGGVLALGVAQLLLVALEAGAPPAVVRPEVAALDWRVLLFALGATALAGAISAWAAAVASRSGSADDLRAAGRLSAGRAARRARAVLVTAEIALAFLLLVGAGLTIRSFTRLLAVDPGLVTAHVATARVSLPSARYDSHESVLQFYDDLLASVGAAPGVRTAGAVSLLPLSGWTNDFNFGVEGHVPAAPGLEPNAQTRIVAGRYFEALGVPVLRGRAFDERDRPDGDQVAMVSASLARQYWPDGRALGRRIKLWSLDDPGPFRTIVGVVADLRHDGPAAPAPPTLYLPATQFLQRTLTVVARGDGAEPPARLIEQRVRDLDPTQPVYDARSMDAWLADTMAQPRFNLKLLSVFAAAALLLAALGIYGVMAHVVSGRTKELGIRVALGAGPARVAGLVIGYGAMLTGAGLLLGAVGAALAGRYVVSLLHGVEPFDAVVYACAATALGAAAVAACVAPARRVLRLDPLRSLRAE